MTVALEAGEVPPAPVQVREYVVVTVGLAVTDPEVPDAVKPVPVQEVALEEDHVRVEDWPDVIVVGLAERVAVGMGVVP